MAHTYSCNFFHLVFSTEGRKNLIPTDLQPKLWVYIAGIAGNHGLHAKTGGGTENHIHLLLDIPPSIQLAKAAQVIKANSSRWMGEHGTKFAWQKGYGSFTVSMSNVPSVVRYIDNQKEHHKKRSFEEEFLGLLKKHKIPFDPKEVYE